MMWSMDAFSICKFYWNSFPYLKNVKVLEVIVIDLTTVFGSSYTSNPFSVISTHKNKQRVTPYEQHHHFGSGVCDSYVSEKNVTFHTECGSHEGKKHILNCSDLFCTYVGQHEPIKSQTFISNMRIRTHSRCLLTVQSLVFPTTLITFILGQAWWAGHAARMEKTWNTYSILSRKLLESDHDKMCW